MRTPSTRRPRVLVAAALALALAGSVTAPAPQADAACYRETIVSPRPYRGLGNDERIELSDGSVWRDRSYRYEYRYDYYPEVTVCSDSTMRLRGDDAFDVWQIR